MKTYIPLTSLLLTLLVLAACGSGDSTAPAKTTVSGFTSKGPFINGEVKIYAVTDGAKDALLARTTTDASGDYTVDISPYAGPIVVEASGTYKDEATNSIKIIPVDSPIRAALPWAQGAVYLPVTALTELAVLKMGSTLSSDTISAANALISDLFKVDVIATSPVAPTTAALAGVTQAQKDYTLALAAVSQMASTSAGENDTAKLNNVLTTLADSITTTGMAPNVANDIITALTDFVNPANTANNLTGITNTTTTNLVNIGTLLKSYKLKLQGSFTPGSVSGIQFDISLPSGVTINADSSTSAAMAGSLYLSSTMSSGALVASRYSSGSLTVGIITSHGLSADEFATLTCNIPIGAAAPASSAFSVVNARIIDINGATVAGAMVAVE